MKKGQMCEGIVEKIKFPNKGIVKVEDSEVTVKNTGAYRKYMYLPTTVSEWRMQGKKRKTGR